MKFSYFLIIGILSVICGLMIIPVSSDENGVTVTDAVGRTVTVPSNISSIVSIYPDSTRVLVALGKGELIKATDSYSHQCPILKQAAPYLSDLPDLGNPYDGTLSMEEITKVQPDVVFISGRLNSTAEKIQSELGIPTVCVRPSIKEYEDFLDTVNLIGKATGTSDRATEISDYITGKFENVIEKTKDLKDSEKPEVLVINTPNTNDPLTVMPSIHPASLQYAGGKNVASSLDVVGASGSPWRSVSFEQVMNWDPKYIFIHGMGLLTPEQLKEMKDWESLQAVKNDSVYKVFIGYVGYDPALLMVQTDHMAKILHPELFSDLSFSKEADEVFKTIYGKSGIYNELESELGLTKMN